MKHKPRGLHPEEEVLWRLVAQRVRPLLPKEKSAKSAPLSAPCEVKTSSAGLRNFRIGAAVTEPGPRHDSAPTFSDRMARAPIRMDRKAYGKMTRGKLTPEARIDLHGMTLAQAHPALTGFVLSAFAAQRRLVLVITGKGKPGTSDGPIPARSGVLKHQVPQWLTTPPLAGTVLQITPAHLKHGGAGAYYVYLRRQR